MIISFPIHYWVLISPLNAIQVGYIIIKIINTQNCLLLMKHSLRLLWNLLQNISNDKTLTDDEGKKPTVNHTVNKDNINYCQSYCQQRQYKLTLRKNTILSSTPKIYDGLIWRFLKLCSEGLFNVSGDCTAAIFSVTESSSQTFTTCCKNPKWPSH
jgi:hypothetical protein